MRLFSTRIVSPQKNLKNIALVSFLAFAPVALAQHGAGGGHAGGGGHVGGGGGHFGGAPHMSAPPAPHPSMPAPHPVMPPHSVVPPRPIVPPNGLVLPPRLLPNAQAHPFVAPGILHFPPRPRPRPPIFIGAPYYFYPPFYGFGFGFGGLGWGACDPVFWGWQYGCYGSPYWGPGYGYGLGSYGLDYQNNLGSNQTYGPQTYQGPPLLYGEAERQYVTLYLKDGTMYDVSDYWLVDNQLHFTTAPGGGQKSTEGVINFDELDLQRTIDVNTERGFHFVLRNEPISQYMQDHPDAGSAPGDNPPASAPAGPLAIPSPGAPPTPPARPQP